MQCNVTVDLNKNSRSIILATKWNLSVQHYLDYNPGQYNDECPIWVMTVVTIIVYIIGCDCC